ncbi:MAG: MFS transporter, partial [Actinobacteria bacterium]|nr:MFS transporter [Actinomycetota bacterium]
LGFTSALLALGIDTALPAFDEIREEFSLADGSGEVSLVVTAYFLGMAAGQLPMGPLSDRFGRRPVLFPTTDADRSTRRQSVGRSARR